MIHMRILVTGKKNGKSLLLFGHRLMTLFIFLYLCRTMDIQVHTSIEGSDKVTNRILPFLHIWKEKKNNPNYYQLKIHSSYFSIQVSDICNAVLQINIL